jgi:hypothetical protein
MGYSKGNPVQIDVSGAVNTHLNSIDSQLADIAINVKLYGAKGDGVTDDTSAMQAAHNTGKTVFYPKGTYKFTTITIPSGGIVGHSRYGTQLFSSDTSTNDSITFTDTNTGLFEKFTFYSQTSKTNGSGLNIKPASGENVKTRINDVYIYQFPTCIHFSSASQWNITNSYLENYSVSGLLIENTNNADSGDSVISGCILSAVQTTSNNIVYHSSGGLKIVGNKFLGGSNSLNLDIKGIASDLLIMGNSFEGSVSSSITLQRSSGTATFKNIVIVGNQFLKPSYIIQTDNSGAFSNIVIESNSFTLDNTASGNGILLNNVKDFTVGSNVFQGSAGQTAIYIESTCVNGKILPNTYTGLGSISNNSTSVYVTGSIQSGSSTATTSSTYGSMFTNTITITFPQPFLVTPTCWANLSSLTGGGISVSVHNITTTNMQVSVIGLNNSASIAFDWFAEGII